MSKIANMQGLYGRDATIISLCYDSLKEAGISPKDIGRELSTYGATGFGETFAECIAEVQTRRNPISHELVDQLKHEKLSRIESRSYVYLTGAQYITKTSEYLDNRDMVREVYADLLPVA